jgi:ABC-2 type transport system permease protein
MIPTLLRIGWINIRRDRVVQAMMFLLPILFFSIFALVFGNQRRPMSAVRVAVVDEDHTEYSKRFIQALRDEGALHVRTTVPPDSTGSLLDRAGAEKLVREGKLPVAIVLPKGLGARPIGWGGSGNDTLKIQLLADVSDPVAPQLVQGLLQKVGFTVARDSMATSGIRMFEKYAGALTAGQKAAVDKWTAAMSEEEKAPADSQKTNTPTFGVPTELINVIHPDEGDTATISFYAAGIGVMFLLFSCAGAGGALLEEEEAGTLGRLLGSRLGIRGVLAGKWMFITLGGIAQLVVMFVWGALVLKLPLLSHIPGFVVMTVATAMAAASFGLLLATISRSRQQLSGLSTIIILAMSAVGGSMFPRFLMSETMQSIGLITFNAWALDGFLKVFWRDAPIVDLWPQVGVLLGITAVFLTLSRFFARRWEVL